MKHPILPFIVTYFPQGFNIHTLICVKLIEKYTFFARKGA